MDMVPLSASARDAKANPKVLRRKGQIPAVVYGHKVQMSVQCMETDLHKAFIRAGESTLVELDVDGKKIPVLFKHVAFDPVSDREVHVDFYAVNMDKEIETLVPVHFDGEPIAVKSLGGVFVISHDHVKVRCLPKNLPHSLPVSVTQLAEFRQSVSVKDLQAPAGVRIMDNAETVLATIQEPRKEEEIVTTVVAPAEGEVVPGAEGAVPAEGAAAGAPGADAQAKEKSAKEGAAKEKPAKK